MEPRLTHRLGVLVLDALTHHLCQRCSKATQIILDAKRRHSSVGIDYRHLQKREMILCEQHNSPFLSLDPKPGNHDHGCPFPPAARRWVKQLAMEQGQEQNRAWNQAWAHHLQGFSQHNPFLSKSCAVWGAESLKEWLFQTHRQNKQPHNPNSRHN